MFPGCVYFTVQSSNRPTRVARCSCTDLLLSRRGLWVAHRVLQLQPDQKRFYKRRHHGLPHKLRHINLRKRRSVLLHRLSGNADILGGLKIEQGPKFFRLLNAIRWHPTTHLFGSKVR